MNIDRKTLRAWSMMGPAGFFGVAMNELAGDESLGNEWSVLTADLCSFSGLERFAREYPNRFYNVGIAEQNLIGVAAGMAAEGIKTVAATYASFACSRALDNVRVACGYMKLPLVIVGLTSGFASGILGATHMAIEDAAIMRTMPDMVVLSPADCLEEYMCLKTALKSTKPVYIRLTGTQRMPIVYEDEYDFCIGRNMELRSGTDVCILSTGSMVAKSLEAARILQEQGVEARVVNVCTLKPFDDSIIKELDTYRLVVTAEEHSVIGGLGSIVAEAFAKNAYEFKKMPKFIRIGINDYFPHAASYEYLMEACRLTAGHMAERIAKELQ